MKFLVLTGPQAVGKMTVGQELVKLTGLKLLHNHMTIELVAQFFSYGTPEGKRLVAHFRREILDAVAKSDLPGMIFTYMCAYNLPEDIGRLDDFIQIFASRGADIYYVELEADVQERLRRNVTPNRLANKPTKRDTAWSERDLLNAMDKYRLNSLPGEIPYPNYLRIDNTNLSPQETARLIQSTFDL